MNFLYEMMKKSFLSNFVPMGASAPDTLPPGDLWIDVGNRAGPGVLDHHGGATAARSSCELVQLHYQEWVLDPTGQDEPVTLVLHSEPDLDAISAAWLALGVLSSGDLPKPVEGVAAIVDAVSAHDQGFLVSETLEDNWPLVVRTRLEIDAAGAEGASILELGMALLDTTLGILAEGEDMETAARHLVTQEVRSYFETARRQYMDDLKGGTEFIARLPLQKAAKRPSCIPNRPLDPPSGANWIPMDGLLLEDPVSPLFKELARTDREHSSLRRGFSLLVVSWSLSVPGIATRLYRHTISTDPQTGAHLQGLGKRLETKEQQHEQRDGGGTLLEGRQRVLPGTGRHGYNVISPWYDGRGHNFTIVDSPSVVIDGVSRLVSRLSPSEVLKVVKDYG